MEWLSSYYSSYRERPREIPYWQRELHPLRAFDLAQTILDPMLSEMLGTDVSLRQGARHRKTQVASSSSTVLFDYSEHIHRHGIGIDGIPPGYVPYHKKGEQSFLIVDPNVNQYIDLGVRKLLTPDQLFYFAEEEGRIVNAVGRAVTQSEYLAQHVQLVQGVGSELLTVAGDASDHDVSIVCPGIDLARLNRETILFDTLREVSGQVEAKINFIFCHIWDEQTDWFKVETVTY